MQLTTKTPGLDYQGRVITPPQRVDDDIDDLACAEGILRAVIWVLGLYAIGIVCWLLLF